MLSRLYRYFTGPSTSSPFASAKELVDAAVKEHDLLIFSKTTCPYCLRAKSIFRSELPAVQAKVYELDERDDGDEIQDYLKEKTGQRTVPNIFIRQKHIGGCDAVVTLDRDDKLAELFTNTAQHGRPTRSVL